MMEETGIIPTKKNNENLILRDKYDSSGSMLH
jgi:hypothetical protein